VPERTRAEPAVRNRRRHVREKVSIEAHLFIRGETHIAIPCKVADLSQGGARIKMAVPYDLPSHVFLVKYEGEIIYECETIWQKNQKAGLMFLDLCAHSKLQQLRCEMWRAEMLERGPTQSGRPPHSS
jgi:hypothetical protein